MNPFLIGIPGFLVSLLVAYVLGEIALKYLTAEQVGEVVLRVRRERLRLLWMMAVPFAVLLVIRYFSSSAAKAVAPYFFITLLILGAWYSWCAWRGVQALQTPLPHRRLFGAALASGFLAMVFICGAAAATAFVPKEWLESSKPGTAAAARREGRMDLNRFWKIIDKVHERAGDDLEERTSLLEDELEDLELEDIAAFQRHYDAQMRSSYRWDLWGAAYVINGGCSDDCFDYFRDWLISEGRVTFEAALDSPDSLAQLPHLLEAENELFGYVARRVYRSKAGHEMETGPHEKIGEPKGKEWKEEDLPSLFPRLSEKYGG